MSSFGLSRRRLLLALAAGAGVGVGPARALPARTLVFPRDHGAHPDLRTEWWYVTGRARAGTRTFGFQVTFFRSRVDTAQRLQSAFAAHQLLFAHAAVTDVQGRRLWHDQRIARAGFGIAQAASDDTRLSIRDWSLVRQPDGRYHACLPAGEFALDLRFAPTQPLLLQGQQGLSRKGPETRQASYYYSQPQLQASGRCRAGGRDEAVTGRAWLDHEWSSAYLPRGARGWDWVGLNFDDGSALMAFRMRGQSDEAVLWAAGTWRDARGNSVALDAQSIRFTPLRHWQSPRTAVRFPVAFRLVAGALEMELQPLMDDQESDSRATTGAIYWEGAMTVLRGGRRVGRGYLELTGYGEPLRI